MTYTKLLASILLSMLFVSVVNAGNYKIVDTDQSACYDNNREINTPVAGEAFYGQDAQHDGFQPSYRDNGDGTITDLNTGLIWQKNLPSYKYNQADCATYARHMHSCRI